MKIPRIHQNKSQVSQARPHILYKMLAVVALSFNMAFALPPVLGPMLGLGLSQNALPAPLIAQVSAAPGEKDEPQTNVPALPPMTVPKQCPQGQCIIDKYIIPFINFVSALVGVGVTMSIIYAGIQYAASGDNAQKVSAARQRITTSIFVLIGYFVFYAFLNWVIPGGIANL